MGKIIKGNRPRPRVAILGTFDDETLSKFQQLFPTIWSANIFSELAAKVHLTEIDLIIIGTDYEAARGNSFRIERDYFSEAHIICFSNQTNLPGPYRFGDIYANYPAETEEFLLPDVPLEISRQRDFDLSATSDIRGWNRLEYGRGTSEPIEEAKEKKRILFESSIIIESNTKIPLAVLYLREKTDLGIAWLPNPVFDQKAWVELICMQWAQTDRVRFPTFGNWQKTPEWMIPDELIIASKLNALEEHRRKLNSDIDKQVAELNLKLTEAALAANHGHRRLITAQGKELVDEVVAIFREFGFTVQLMDDELDPEQAKREDLRLTVPEITAWEAIVEVRGYGRSSGQTSDLQRLARFAAMYQQEKGHLPDKRIYAVNGEIETSNPNRRHEPLAAAKEDILEFAKDGGVVIWTLDMFRCIKRVAELQTNEFRQSIIEATGRWKMP